MLSSEIEPREIHFLVRSMFETIREINRRIDELNFVTSNPLCSQALANDLEGRTASLHNTKNCIIKSIYDLSLKISKDESMSKVFNINNLQKELDNL